VTGEVAELPDALERGVRFIFVVDPSATAVPARIQLSWYRARDEGADVPAVRPGERWRLTVRLKRPHGFANPDGFDYEAWLLERNIRATGYVRADGDNVRLAPAVLGPMARVHRLRDAVRMRFAASLPDADYAGVLIALAVGDQRSILPGQWVVFRNTAVAHLVSAAHRPDSPGRSRPTRRRADRPRTCAPRPCRRNGARSGHAR
jgi:competence protein ComEC